MKTPHRVMLMTATVMVSGCATGSRMTADQRVAAMQDRAAVHDRTMDQWTGRDISDLIVKRGQPLKVEGLPNGRQVYTWDGGVHATDPRNGQDIGYTCLERYVVDPATHLVQSHNRPGC
jgi:hypothetical protein